MNSPTKKYLVIIAIMAIVVIAVFSALHASCHSDAYSLCLATMCAFVLASAGVAFILSVIPLVIAGPANRGVLIPYRLERPPRT